MNTPLPTTRRELTARGWHDADIIIITGDAYVDHPSFGAAIIGRWLEHAGYRVGIIAQPQKDTDYTALGTPRLFFAITAGNMDSMINHYTAQKKIRSEDAYSPDGKTGLRPNRATIFYSQQIKRLFSSSPIVLGGIEASLRRIPHYDYWADTIRNSVLLDAKADILIYGMGERAILEVAHSFASGHDAADVTDIPGTVVSTTATPPQDAIMLPQFHKKRARDDFWKTNSLFFAHHRTHTLWMPFAGRYLKHNPPAAPLSKSEMDEVYALPFTRRPHPRYGSARIAAYEQIRNSITSHRGCFGGCNFCAIGAHQGKSISSRSEHSVLAEVAAITAEQDFSGEISDIGGPTANMYGMSCALDISESCKRTSCLQPDICPNLRRSHTPYRSLLAKARRIPRVKHLRVSSGIRHDLALHDTRFMKDLVEHYTGGLVKLAPEHASHHVLRLMNKPGFDLYEKFHHLFGSYSRQAGKRQFIVPYMIVGHPGTRMQDAIELALYLKQNGIQLKQIQEFTPTPLTISTMMYVTGKDQNGRKVYIPQGREIRLQKALVQWFIPANRKLVLEALKLAKKTQLISRFYGEKKHLAVTVNHKRA
jgi:uncharacterized radical SAM protein YgiQ